MKVIETAVKVKQSHKFKEATFMVSQEDQSHLLHILRDQVYSDKVLAVIREYSTNAMDANIEAGNPDRAIEVKIPTSWDLFFSVRDFGPGLSFERIQNVFVKYGSSTKRDSNSQVGQLGIGAKSGFAYGHQFTIESYIDGTKTIYSAIIDESKCGKVVQLSESETTEENGTKIIIPVKASDIDAFTRKASSLYSWFKVAPLIKGIQESVWATMLNEQRGKPLISGSGWEIMDSGRSTIRMGCLPYPLNAEALNITRNDTLSEVIRDQRILIDVPVGSVQITPSRESLSYDPATIKVITDKLHEVRKEMQKKVKAQIDGCKTLWEAKVVARAFSDRATMSLVKGLTWGKDGVKVSGGPFHFNRNEGFIKNFALGYARNRWSGPKKIMESQIQDINASDSEMSLLVEDDMVDDSKRHESQRINALLRGLTTPPQGFKTYTNITLIKKGKDWDLGVNRNGFDCPSIVKLSSLPRYKRDELEDYAGTSGAYSPEKNKSKQLRLILDRKVSGYKSQDQFEVCNVDLNAGGVCAEVSSYSIRGYRYSNSAFDLHSNLKGLSIQFGVTLPDVICLKPKLFSEESVKSQWTTLENWLKSEVVKLLPAVFFQEVLDLEEYARNNSSNVIAPDLAKKVGLKVNNRKSPFLNHVNKIGRGGLTGLQKYSRSTLDNLLIPYGPEVEKLRKKATMTSLLDYYPLLEFIDTYPHSQTEKKTMLISDYINMVDDLAK